VNWSAFSAIVPVACVVAAAIATMTAEAFRARGERMPMAPLGIVGLVGAAIASVLLWDQNATSFGVVTADNFGLFVGWVIIAVAILTLAISGPPVDRQHLPQGEYYALVLFATAGMMLMAIATDLLVIFIALEIMSLAVYVLTGLKRQSPGAVEGAFKYFLLGAVASAFLLYGIAFTYGVTGSTALDEVGRLVAAQALAPTPMQRIAVGLVLVGFAFKVSAVPFHMWTPDAYEGASPAVAGFMSTGVKAAAFAAFTRVFLSAFEPLQADWAPLVWAIAAATMIGGTLVGVVQTSIKRMLAYSSIAHAGYLLVALLSANEVGKGAILFYLLVYAFTNLGAFGVVAMMEAPGRANDRVGDYAGLWQTRPRLAGLMTIFLLSLGGFPPLGGFIAKWYVFSAAVTAGYYWLAVIGVLTSVVSVFFYLRIVVQMYMADEHAPGHRPAVPRVAAIGMIIAVIAVFYLGILPGRLLSIAADSVTAIF
jgi:NADH-quinone oxidoreductase subunit N